MSVEQLSNEQILKQLEELPRERRVELAKELLASAHPETEHRATQPLRKLVGIANPEGKTFTDEELDRMLDEERVSACSDEGSPRYQCRARSRAEPLAVAR